MLRAEAARARARRERSGKQNSIGRRVCVSAPELFQKNGQRHLAARDENWDQSTRNVNFQG